MEIVGHYSLDTHCDTWIAGVARKLGIEREVLEVEIDHFRESVNDQTRAETSAAYAETHPAFIQKHKLRGKDIARLSAHIFRHGRALRIQEKGGDK